MTPNMPSSGRVDVTKPAYVDWYGKGRHQNWRTPTGLFNELHAEYGFTMDGASEPGNGLLPVASTADHPIDWTGHRVFCNPPWSNIRPFIEMAPAANCAVFLVPARTNVAWFHRALELGAKPRFFKGRPKFELHTHDGPGHNSPVDCMLLVFNGKTELTELIEAVEAEDAAEQGSHEWQLAHDRKIAALAALTELQS